MALAFLLSLSHLMREACSREVELWLVCVEMAWIKFGFGSVLRVSAPLCCDPTLSFLVGEPGVWFSSRDGMG